MQKSPPSPNYGEILVRLYWLGEVFDSRPIATYNEIFIQIGQLVRKIFTDKLFRTDRQTDRRTDRHTDKQTDRHTHVKLKTSFLDVSVLAESGNVLIST